VRNKARMQFRRIGAVNCPGWQMKQKINHMRTRQFLNKSGKPGADALQRINGSE